MRALLDVNVLIALLDTEHVHHASATTWVASKLHLGWASCPLTVNGCIRIMSQPKYGNGGPPAMIAGRLRDAMQTDAHAFWPDDLNLVTDGVLDWQAVLSSRHLTDVYLLALAVGRGGRLVTLDRSVPLAAVVGAKSNAMVVLD